jgi:CheY-like chemotaxis protein
MAASVMIVEDDRDTREMLGRFLELEGFDVRTAENGQKALEVLRSDGPTCVILLDLMMPVMNGWQFREAQASDPRFSQIPVIVVTAAGRAMTSRHHRRRVALEAGGLRPPARRHQSALQPA